MLHVGFFIALAGFCWLIITALWARGSSWRDTAIHHEKESERAWQFALRMGDRLTKVKSPRPAAAGGKGRK